MKADTHRDRLVRIRNGLAKELRRVGNALTDGRPLDDGELHDLASTLSRLANDARATAESNRLETRPLFYQGDGRG